MNVPMSPAVRCSFDAEDGILRIVLKEAITAEGGNGAGTHELVVYAIKVSSSPFPETPQERRSIFTNSMDSGVESPSRTLLSLQRP